MIKKTVFNLFCSSKTYDNAKLNFPIGGTYFQGILWQYRYSTLSTNTCGHSADSFLNVNYIIFQSLCGLTGNSAGRLFSEEETEREREREILWGLLRKRGGGQKWLGSSDGKAREEEKTLYY